MTTKNCSRCHELKELSEFYRNKKHSSGRNSHCKECEKSINRAFRENNKEYLRKYHKEYRLIPKNKARRAEIRYLRDSKSPRAVMQTTLKHGLERRPTENPATIEDLMKKWEDQNGKCAVTGITMTWNKGTVLPTSISLDRIDPNGGYSSDNLRLICHAINAFKGRMTDDQMYDMALAIVENMRKPKLRLVS